MIPKSKNSTFNLFNSYPNSKDAMPITDGKGHIENRQVWVNYWSGLSNEIWNLGCKYNSNVQESNFIKER